ncbi:MAG: class I SAM-dependent methyltransferase [Actinomycetota bacterium]
MDRRFTTDTGSDVVSIAERVGAKVRELPDPPGLSWVRDQVDRRTTDGRTTRMSAALADYVRRTWVQESDAAAALRAATRDRPGADMQIGPDQGQLLGWLVRTLDVRRAIEVGVFTGYSALAVASALPEDGLLVACDVEPDWTSVGEPYWRQAGVDGRIDLRIAPAAETLRSLLDDGQAGTFDLAFIDADKTGYATYYELCLELLRPGGVVAIDNVLWGGSVADPGNTDPDTEAIREINRIVTADDRVHACLVPIGDGLTLATKRAG